jgi:DNA-binding beta-propeller fold protein YncE
MHRLKLVGFLLLSVFVLSCVPRNETGHEHAVKLVWPPAPLEAKIEWKREVSLLEKRLDQGFWGNVMAFLAGSEERQLSRPYGVVSDNQDRLFIADTAAAAVYIYDLKKDSYQIIEQGEELELRSPIGLAYGQNDLLYITDSALGLVLRYNLQTAELTKFSPYKFQRPTGIRFNWKTNRLYVTDTKAHEIVVLESNGVEAFRFGGRGVEEGKFNHPTDLWVDLQNQVYVTDALNSRIQIFTAQGQFLRSFGEPGDTPGSFAKPKGVAVDPAGHIYVCDALFDAVQIFDANGRLLMDFGANGNRPGEFWMPSGIHTDRRGYIYVTDTYNKRIQVFEHINCVGSHDCKPKR